LQQFDRQHKENILRMEFSPDNLNLVSGSFDNTINLWESKTWKLIRKLDYHINSINDLKFNI
jgi:WD40 repeat protein